MKSSDIFGVGCVFNAKDFGAAGDGQTQDSFAIQKAINACADSGGGTVILPKGDYLSSTIILKSNVTLYLAANASILGTGKVEDYPKQAIIYAEGQNNIGLSGKGVIDGRGKGVEDKPDHPRYVLTAFEHCRDITLTGVTLKDSAFWATHFEQCKQIRVDGVDIYNRVNKNNDGLDFIGCQDVFVSNCNIRCQDDAFAIMSREDSPGKNITITNCIMSTRWAGVRIGPASRGNLENITVSNCVIKNAYGCGIKLQMAEGAVMQNLVFSNLAMDNVTGPISLHLGNWVYGLPQWDNPPDWSMLPENKGRPIGKLRNVLFNNIRANVTAGPPSGDLAWLAPSFADGERKSCINITGVPGHYIEGITFSNIDITFPGGGTAQEAENRNIPEYPDHYPEYFMFGVLPSYGLYARHVKDLTLDNVRFSLAGDDMRPAIVCNDVNSFDIRGFRADSGKKTGSLIRLEQSQDVFITASGPKEKTQTFLRVEGEKCRNISLVGNDLRKVEIAFDLDGILPQNMVEMKSNLCKNTSEEKKK